MPLEIVLHAFLLLVGFGSVLAGFAVLIKHIQMFRIFSAKMKMKYSYAPAVSVIVPVRGLEEKTEENVLSLLHQDYKAMWEVVFVVDKDDKKTERKIREIIKKSKVKNAKVIHNKLLETCSGKSAALVCGAKSARYKVVAACDSDAKVRDTWLAALVAPLSQNKIGATTGFRFYVPGTNISSYILSAWNAVGYIALQGKYPFIWGGGFAIRKSLIKKLDLLEIWSMVVSDDSAVARALLSAKLKSYFVPACIALSYPSQFSDLKEFTTRQLTIIRWNWSSAFWTGFLAFVATRLGIVLGLITLIAYSLTNNFLFFIESFLLLLIIPLELIIANIDFKFSKILTLEMSRTKWSAAYLLAHWLMAYNISKALRKKTVKWRGRTYNFANEAKII